MTPEELAALARKAGIKMDPADSSGEETWYGIQYLPSGALARFAALVAEHCAQIAATPVSGEQDDITMAAKDRAANAIRAAFPRPKKDTPT